MANDTTSSDEPYPTIQSLRGIAGSLPQPMPWQEVEEMAQDEHADDVR